MSTDLMKPRYKVINTYPHSTYQIGETIDGTRAEFLKEHFDSFPHLFQKLEWWMDRTPEELPEYVKRINGFVFKVEYWKGENFKGVPLFSVSDSIDPFGLWDASDYLPATAEEYETYQKLKEKV